MVDPGTFLTALSVTVDESVVPVPVRPGPAARLTPSVGVTLALFGQWQQCATARAFSRDAVQHLRRACPTLPARSQDNRLLRRGHDVIAKPKRCAPDYWPQPVRRWHARIRQIVETVHNRLLATFGLEHERPHDLAAFRTRLATEVGLHTFCLWLNVHLGRPPLAFADVIDW